jgi:hypothetical protein
MAQARVLTPIPKDRAFQLCAEIRQKYSGKWWTLAGMQCTGCIRFSKGDPTKMCVMNRPDYRGCNLVNARYDRETGH